jgi:hypothetical protein
MVTSASRSATANSLPQLVHRHQVGLSPAMLSSRLTSPSGRARRYCPGGDSCLPLHETTEICEAPHLALKFLRLHFFAKRTVFGNDNVGLTRGSRSQEGILYPATSRGRETFEVNALVTEFSILKADTSRTNPLVGTATIGSAS